MHSRRDESRCEPVPGQPFLLEGRFISAVVGTACGMQCSYCSQHHDAGRSMAPEDLDACVVFLGDPGMGPRELVFYGGEPLLEMGLIRRAVTRVRDGPSTASVVLRVFTNGLGLSRATAQFLDAHRVNVTLSFDGVAAAQDERAPGTFHVLDALLGRLRLEQPVLLARSLTVKMTLTSRNLQFLAASVRYLLGKGIRDIEVAPLVTHDPGWDSAATEELDRQLAEVAEVSAGDPVGTGHVAFAAFRGAPVPASRPTPPVRMCGLGSPTALVVDVDGTVAPCGALVPSCQRALPTLLDQVVSGLEGCHVRDADLAARLASRHARAARMPLLTGKEHKGSTGYACAACEWLGACGACPVAIGHVPGNTDPDRIPDLQCVWNHLVLEHRRAFQKSVRIAACGDSRGAGENGDSSVRAERHGRGDRQLD